MSDDNERPVLFLFTPGLDYVRPYFERYMDEYEISDSAENATYAVMVSSTDVYDVSQGLNYNELAPVRDNSKEYLLEREFMNSCTENRLHWSALRCASIVCTGMQGRPREIAEKIYRGTYIGLSDNDAVCNVVHAVDLPQAARITLGSDDIYNVTDGEATKVNDLADALAWRIAQKRLFFLPRKWFKLLFGKKKLDAASRTLTFSIEKIKSKGNFLPHYTVEYLKTHDYNDESL